MRRIRRIHRMRRNPRSRSRPTNPRTLGSSRTMGRARSRSTSACSNSCRPAHEAARSLHGIASPVALAHIAGVLIVPGLFVGRSGVRVLAGGEAVAVAMSTRPGPLRAAASSRSQVVESPSTLLPGSARAVPFRCPRGSFRSKGPGLCKMRMRTRPRRTPPSYARFSPGGIPMHGQCRTGGSLSRKHVVVVGEVFAGSHRRGTAWSGGTP